MGKSRRLILVLATLAVVASGCVGAKPGSFKVGQVGGVGPLRLSFELCSGAHEGTVQSCSANDREGEAQSFLGFLVPKGSGSPATLAATPLTPGAASINYSRNAEVAQKMLGPEGEGSLPPGTELVGYLSQPYFEKAGEAFEWAVKADFGLPVPADGGSFATRSASTAFVGWREVDGMNPASRPLDCQDTEPAGGGGVLVHSGCSIVSEPVEYGLSDLMLTAPAPATVFVGGKASFAFGLDFASAVTPVPSFALGASSTLPKAAATLAEPTFVAGPINPANNRAPLVSRTVQVAVPASAKAGTYDVTLTATASSGGVVTGTAQLRVIKPKLGFKLKLDKAKGTAIVRVKVPSAGTLTVAGKGIRQVKRKPSKAKWVNLTVKPKGGAKATLAATGKVKVKAKLKFKPVGAAAVTQTKTISLVQQ